MNSMLKSKLLIISIVLSALFMTSCKERTGAVKHAKKFFTEYTIPETIFKNEWGMMSYKLYNPRLQNYGMLKKTDEEGIYKLLYHRYCKGKMVNGKVKKLRLVFFIDVRSTEDGKHEVIKHGFQDVFKLSFGRQVGTWFAWLAWGLVLLLAYFGNSLRSYGALVFFQLFWLVWVGFISYHCFLSGWGVVGGLLFNGFIINSVYAANRY